MTLKTGDKAPSFKLFNTDKQEVSLEDYKGKNLVVLFFPQAFTGTCTKELCSVRDDIGRYSNINTDLVAISVDSLFTLKRYKEEQNLPFPLLSDFNKETSRTYGCIYEEWIHNMKGVSKRSVFIIDREGIICYAEVLEVAGELPNFAAIETTLASLK